MKPTNRRLPALAGALIMASGVAAYAKEAPSLAELNTSGGLSVNGPCFSHFIVRTDGKFTYDDESKAHSAGTLAPAELSRLQKAIKSADYALLQETNTSAIAPSAGDGGDVVLTVVRNGSATQFHEWRIPNFFKLEPVKTLTAIRDKQKPH